MEQRAPGRQRALTKPAVADAAKAAVTDASLAADEGREESFTIRGHALNGIGPAYFAFGPAPASDTETAWLQSPIGRHD